MLHKDFSDKIIKVKDIKKEELHKWEDLSCKLIRKLNIVKIAIFPRIMID